MHVLLEDELGRLTLRELRRWHRMRAWCLAARLDRELARGARPEVNVGLAARAARLTSMRFRLDLAASLQRLLAAAGFPPVQLRALSTAARLRRHDILSDHAGELPVLPAAGHVAPVAARPSASAARQPHVPIRVARIRRSAPELAELAGRLVQPGPVPVRGVAMVCQLLTDGGGPLYREACPDDLTALVERAVQELNG